MNRKDEIKRYVAHFGAISFNYSITGFIITIAALFLSVFSWLLIGIGVIGVTIYNIILSIVGIFSLGLLFVSENFREMFNWDLIPKISNFGDKLQVITAKIFEVIPYVAIGVAILSIVSFCCLIVDKTWPKAKCRLITLAIMVIVLITLAILIFAGVFALVGKEV